jgi:hypothetical protein
MKEYDFCHQWDAYGITVLELWLVFYENFCNWDLRFYDFDEMDGLIGRYTVNHMYSINCRLTIWIMLFLFPGILMKNVFLFPGMTSYEKCGLM